MYLKKTDTVVFDPANKEHRAAVICFLKRRAWADSPIRFTHDPAYGSVSDQVQSKLLVWYASQEEAKLRKRADRKEAMSFEASKELAFQMAGIASEYQPSRIRKVAG